MDDKSCVMVPGIQAICTEWSATCIQIPLAYESISTRPFAKWAARGLCSNGSLTRWCSYFFWWLSGFLCGAVMFFVIGRVSMSSFFLYHCSSHPGFRHGIEDGAGGGEGQLDRLQEPFVCRGAQPPGQEVGCTVWGQCAILASGGSKVNAPCCKLCLDFVVKWTLVLLDHA